jgi:hypothetical protein
LRTSSAVAASGRSGKSFWTTREDAERFIRLLVSRWGVGPNWLVEVRISPDLLERLVPRTTDARPALFVDEEDLAWFNGVMEFVVL